MYRMQHKRSDLPIKFDTPLVLLTEFSQCRAPRTATCLVKHRKHVLHLQYDKAHM